VRPTNCTYGSANSDTNLGIITTTTNLNVSTITYTSESIALGLSTVPKGTSVAIGKLAQANQTAGVAIGESTNAPQDAVSIGFQAGLVQSVGSQKQVAIGYKAGITSQGSFAIAIGTQAGADEQNDRTVAIGDLAGQIQQGRLDAGPSIAIGKSAGRYSQYGNAIALGDSAGSSTQRASAVAIGRQAGELNQGTNSIAIGTLAGNINQHPNSIALNASGFALDPTTTGLFIDPIRVSTTTSALYYDATNKEVFQGSPTTFYGATVEATAGAIENYMIVNVNGTNYKLALYSLS
jgi:hypothetical protein